MDTAMQDILALLALHRQEPHYAALLRQLRLRLDEEQAQLWAASPLWAGQPPRTEE